MKRLIIHAIHAILKALERAGVAMVGPIDWDFGPDAHRVEPATQDLDGDR
jgi:hypothetical protein